MVNIRKAYFTDFSRLQAFYENHEDHIDIINVQLTNTGRYCIFYLAE